MQQYGKNHECILSAQINPLGVGVKERASLSPLK
jgi:hypothetical protein